MSRQLLLLLFLSSCSGVQNRKDVEREWRFVKEIKLDFSPMGIAKIGKGLWLSDVKGKRIVNIDMSGKILKIHDSIDRPMHLSVGHSLDSAADPLILIPQYGDDRAFVKLENGRMKRVDISRLKVDGLASVFNDGKYTVFSDFYNHRVIVQLGGHIVLLGKKGHHDGEFFYPTDVEIQDKRLYVADAYNNRVQVFGLNGDFIFSVGVPQKINVASGISINDTRLGVTDFEGDRVHIYDKEGHWIETLSDGISKPSDLLLFGEELFVLNYSSKKIRIYHRTSSK